MIIKDHHEPIISRQLFDEANRILDARSLSQEGKAKHSSRYPFSGKIKCGRCGASYVARYKTRKDGSRYKSWRCYEAANHGGRHIDKAGVQVGCSGESIRNEEALYIMRLVCRQLSMDRQKISHNLIRTINRVVSMDREGSALNVPEDKADIKRVVDELLDGIACEEEFYTRLLDKMVINDRDNIDVYLNSLPFKWSYTAVKSSSDSAV